MGKSLKALLVEDNEDDSALLLRELHRAGYDVESVRVDTRPAMEQALSQNQWDVILSDYSMPQFSGVAALGLYQEKGLDIPFVIVSGAVGEASAVEVMRAGAHDYLMKDKLTRLGAVIDREMRETEVRRQRKLAEQRLRLTQFAVDHASQAIMWVDEHGTVAYLNEETAGLLGYRREELFGNNLHNLVPQLSNQDWPSYWQEVKQKNSLNYQITTQRRDGAACDLDITANFVNYEGQELLITFIRDITEQKLAEKQLRTLNRALRVTSECNQALIRANEENDLFEDVCQIVVKLGGYRLAWIGSILADSSGTILVVGKHGLDDHFLNLKEIHWKETPDRHEPAATAVTSGAPAMIHDLERDAPPGIWRDEALKRGFAAVIALPLIFQGASFGVLEIYSEEKNAFIPAEVELLKEMAGDLSYGIHTLRVRTERRLAEFLLEQSNAELNLTFDATLEGWARALELRDFETAGHSNSVVEETLNLSRIMGVSVEDLDNIKRGALLHDIGKMGIPDSILLKPGPLTDEEWVIMRKHPIYAYQLLGGIPFLQHALDIPYCHHEKWDGTGYPRGLKAEEIPLSARIFAVVDVWDALIGPRPYRKEGWSEQRIAKYLIEQSDKHFDPTVVQAFLKLKGL
jgi:PAS domain S-box-containing protein